MRQTARRTAQVVEGTLKTKTASAKSLRSVGQASQIRSLVTSQTKNSTVSKDNMTKGFATTATNFAKTEIQAASNVAE